MRVWEWLRSGQMCNIDENGATSMMFHSFPFVNEFDPHSGDYGLGFFDHSVEAGAYYVQHPQFGETLPTSLAV